MIWLIWFSDHKQTEEVLRCFIQASWTRWWFSHFYSAVIISCFVLKIFTFGLFQITEPDAKYVLPPLGSSYIGACSSLVFLFLLYWVFVLPSQFAIIPLVLRFHFSKYAFMVVRPHSVWLYAYIFFIFSLSLTGGFVYICWLVDFLCTEPSLQAKTSTCLLCNSQTRSHRKSRKYANVLLCQRPDRFVFLCHTAPKCIEHTWVSITVALGDMVNHHERTRNQLFIVTQSIVHCRPTANTHKSTKFVSTLKAVPNKDNIFSSLSNIWFLKCTVFVTL